MKTDVIVVSSSGDQMNAALNEAEKVAGYKNLSRKSALHLRLLTEEMMSMMRAVAGDVTGRFWIEDDGEEFQLHLKVNTDMDEEQREKLISASTSGKNEATRGFMGKIRAFFEPVEGYPMFVNAGMPDSTAGLYNDMSWSMRQYRQQLMGYVEENRSGAAEAWDELEKSVVSHVADDVKVSIYGRNVELVIVKKMA